MSVIGEQLRESRESRVLRVLMAEVVRNPGLRRLVPDAVMGRVDVSIRGEHVRTRLAGESFGEIALLRDIPRTATITTANDVTLRSIDRDLFLPAVTGNGESTSHAEQVVSWRLGIV
ncbi:MAG: cyclic nucleotide-binding domain-containing protein [Actinobacteria bacterium]|uniref:Unannotated protein n=1 Tax=freshwater metagenome TaxID=449393 RepID=A0A6J6GD79_9ZZZZ|nr:cyclic nucleotide-binding domain-containing protein [Actinomycetota bacterium]